MREKKWREEEGKTVGWVRMPERSSNNIVNVKIICAHVAQLPSFFVSSGIAQKLCFEIAGAARVLCSRSITEKKLMIFPLFSRLLRGTRECLGYRCVVWLVCMRLNSPLRLQDVLSRSTRSRLSFHSQSFLSFFGRLNSVDKRTREVVDFIAELFESFLLFSVHFELWNWLLTIESSSLQHCIMQFEVGREKNIWAISLRLSADS